jgi:hypothetical protein
LGREGKERKQKKGEKKKEVELRSAPKRAGYVECDPAKDILFFFPTPMSAKTDVMISSLTPVG